MSGRVYHHRFISVGTFSKWECWQLMLQVNVTSDNQNDKLTSDRNSGLVSFIYNGFVLVLTLNVNDAQV